MSKIERVRSVVEGRRPDRAPVSFWHHFKPDEIAGTPALNAHLRHVERYDLDFLKVMNDNNYPRPAGLILSSPKDLLKIKELQGDEEPFMRQLDLLQKLSNRLKNELLLTCTVFSPWSVLRKLTAPESNLHGPPKLAAIEDPRDAALQSLLKADRKGVKESLELIGHNLRIFSGYCIEAGADGIFLSVRDDWVDTPERSADTYSEVVRPADEAIFPGITGGSFNMLHVCGRPQSLELFAAYPFEVINWADRCAGPRIDEVIEKLKPAICAGVDNLKTLPEGTPEECAAEVHDAFGQAGTRPILISPGCTYDPDLVPQANLEALSQAVRNWNY